MSAKVVLESERLTFRQLTEADEDDLLALYSDPEVMRFFDPGRDRAWVRFEIGQCRRHYADHGYWFWAAIHRETGRFIGRCGLCPLVLDGRLEYEVAYMIAREFWGQGFGIEAARAIKEFAFSRGIHRVVSVIAPDNVASIRVAERNGMVYEKHVELGGYLDPMYVTPT